MSSVKVTASHVSYFLPPERGRRKDPGRRILHDISFEATPGEFVYIIGPSGAGKSTLLELLAGRLKRGAYSGLVGFNTRHRNRFWRDTAFVPQLDVHIPVLTVRETLDFAAKLRLGKGWSPEMRRQRIAAVVNMLGLGSCMDTQCGDALHRGISGGQLKRCSIAVEILQLSSLLLLDEPTTGLDSTSAHEVMTFVQRIAAQRRTVFATIHQPSPETFQLASKVLLLAKGRLCYAGSPAQSQNFVQSLGLSTESCANPADVLLRAVSGTLHSQAGCKPMRPEDVQEENKVTAQPSPDVDGKSTVVSGATAHPHESWKASWSVQCSVLLRRSWLVQRRQPEFIRAQLLKNIAVSCLSGMIFYGQGSVAPASEDFDQSSFNVSSLMYFAILYTILGNLQIIPQLCSSCLQYQRERSASAYRPSAYWLAQAIVRLPLLILCHLVFLNIAYWMVQLPPPPYWSTLIVTLLNNLVAFYFAQFFAAALPSAEMALAIFPVTFLFLTSFAGFTVPLQSIPMGWKWAAYVSYPRWAFEGTIAAIFAARLDGISTLAYFGFGKWNSSASIPILLLYIVTLNVLVWWALQPSSSQLRHHVTLEGSAARGKVTSSADNAATLTNDGPESSDQSLRHKLLAAENKNLRLPPFLLESLVGIGSPMLPRVPSDVGQPQHELAQAPRFGLHDFQHRSRKIKKVPGARLLFRDLGYAIKRKGQVHIILEGCDGQVNPGEMCALMGRSGAGKSTLLDLLARRKTSGTITGELDLDSDVSGQTSAYVTQDNVHIGCFTVRETLRFAALLRLRESVSMEERERRVETVLDILGLDIVGDVSVGNAMHRVISGGQLRRLTIGVEIINLPDLIFLDEPTSGLDASLSYELMAAVRNLANQNRSVVCTIHQPSIETFALFDKLTLLARGQQVYHGSTHQVVKYFCSPPLGFTYLKQTNPAEFVMNVLEGTYASEEEQVDIVRRLARVYHNSEMFFRLHRETKDLLAQGQQRRRAAGAAGELRQYPRDTLEINRILQQRQLLKLRRNRHSVIVALLRHVLVALFHGSLYWQMAPDAVQSRLSLLFFAIMFVMMSNQQNIPIIFEDRLQYYREKGARIYGPYSYWMTCATAYVPQCALNSLLYSSILYPMVGLNRDAGNFAYFLLVIFLCNICGLYFCQLLAIALPSASVCVAVFPATLFIFVAVAGFVIRLPSLPSFLGVWVSVVSFARWAYQGLVINEFAANLDISYDQLPSIYFRPDPAEALLQSLAFDGVSKWFSVPILLLNAAAFRIFTYAALFCIDYEVR